MLTLNAMPEERESLQIFPAKLLLFGEYTVLDGGAALSLPINDFYGRWCREGNALEASFLNHIVDQNSNLNFPLDIERLAKDYSDIRFCSSIKMGYGLGSSGALSAAIYHRYSSSSVSYTSSVDQIRHDLALIEGYFHGSSSGFDPLVSYFGSAFMRSEGRCKSVAIQWPQDWHVYLFDGGQKRNTSECVSEYRQMQRRGELNSDGSPMKKLQDGCITALLEKNYSLCWQLAKQLSHAQFAQMKPFILPTIHTYWKAQIDNPDVVMKLCGAGMGGYYLLMSKKPIYPQDFSIPITSVNLTNSTKAHNLSNPDIH